MTKIAVLFNTFIKLKTYDFNVLKKETNFHFIAVVNEDEFELTKKEFGNVFTRILTYSNIKEELGKVLQSYNKSDIRFICISEDNMLYVAELREYFNIIGVKPHTAILLRDKVKMKQKLQEFGVLVPKFGELADFNSFNELQEEFGIPFVLKPKSEFASKDVNIIKTEEDFECAIKYIKRKEDFECESFIFGKLYHIDGIYNDGNVIFEVCNEYSYPNADFKSGKTLLTVPLPRESEISQRASILAKNVITALGYITGATHLEFFITPNDEFVFLEIGGRTAGGLAIPMYNKQFGINIPNLDLLNHFNLVKNTDFKVKSYCFSGIIPFTKGVVLNLKKPELKSKYNIEFLVKEGDVLDWSKSLREIAGKILSESSSFDEAYQDFKNMANFKSLEVK